MKKGNGVTLIELTIVLALFSTIILIATSFLTFGNSIQNKTMGEFDVQSKVRVLSTSINSTIRDSSAVFLLDKTYPDASVNKSIYFSEGWNYLMLNADKTKVIEWAWDGTTHVERTIVEALGGVSYDLIFEKNASANENKLLKYTLNINASGKDRLIETELEGINSIQIVDRSYGGNANTISYREDARVSDIGVAQAAVSFVIDTSGSMDGKLDENKSRLKILQEEANKMIDGLGDYDNIYLSITPFSDKAYNKTNMRLNEMLQIKPNLSEFKDNIINKLTANGYTNTGDGMRRGYYSIDSFNKLVTNQDKTTKNFMIILVDGETNRVSEYDEEEIIALLGNPYPHSTDSFLFSYNFNRWDYNNSRFYYKGGLFGTEKYYNNPQGHSFTQNGKTYEYYSWTRMTNKASSEFNYRYRYRALLEDSRTNTDDYYVSSTGVNNYIKLIGEKIADYKYTRYDGIEVL